MKENTIKITNPDRIARILTKICEANLQVFVRAQENLALAVKARASNVLLAKRSEDSKVLTFRISHISTQGMEYLKRHKQLKVEFIMMATKVVFSSEIVRIEEESVLITFPQSLISIERRKNARFATSEGAMSFVRIGGWEPSSSDFAAVPCFPQYRDLQNIVQVADVSLGGLCAYSYFPAVNKIWQRGVQDNSGSLMLPMMAEIPLEYEIKWVKKVKEHIGSSDDLSRATTVYKFGLEFNDNDEVNLGIKQFINQITQSEAI